jgi:hypothetical protein
MTKAPKGSRGDGIEASWYVPAEDFIMALGFIN